jgi:hypothetical protein
LRSAGERELSLLDLPKEVAPEPAQAGSTPSFNSAPWCALAQRKSEALVLAKRLGSVSACADLAHELIACE